jgi:hypothetical protein
LVFQYVIIHIHVCFLDKQEKPGSSAGLLKAVLAHREWEESPKPEHAKDS